VVDTVKMRRPDFSAANADPTGHVTRDDRGNAVWQWARDVNAVPRLEHSGLSIVEDEATPLGTVRLNKVATKSGYNPYESGLIEKKGRARKRDLQELSRWIELRKQLGGDSKG
jgi:hypothetical protein